MQDVILVYKNLKFPYLTGIFTWRIIFVSDLKG